MYLILTIVVNAESAALKAPKFAKPNERAFDTIFQDIVEEFTKPQRKPSKGKESTKTELKGGLGASPPTGVNESPLNHKFSIKSNRKSLIQKQNKSMGDLSKGLDLDNNMRPKSVLDILSYDAGRAPEPPMSAKIYMPLKKSNTDKNRGGPEISHSSPKPNLRQGLRPSLDSNNNMRPKSTLDILSYDAGRAPEPPMPAKIYMPQTTFRFNQDKDASGSKKPEAVPKKSNADKNWGEPSENSWSPSEEDQFAQTYFESTPVKPHK
jgi:hypothetical protein